MYHTIILCDDHNAWNYFCLLQYKATVVKCGHCDVTAYRIIVVYKLYNIRYKCVINIVSLLIFTTKIGVQPNDVYN